jgi:vacuolar protein sorting-associated protein 35
VLRRVLEQVVGCRDPLAQQYLMQCVAAAFPDDFHLRTLGALLGALPQLAPGVRVHAVLATLLDRLARWAGRSVAGCAGALVLAAVRGEGGERG